MKTLINKIIKIAYDSVECNHTIDYCLNQCLGGCKRKGFNLILKEIQDYKRSIIKE